MAGGRSAAAAVTLRGRHDERALLDGLLEGARAGQSGARVLRGAAGIGETALLEYAVESASDLTVLRAVGVEPELELAFGGLHQVCAPILERLDGIPAPQRDALRVTFGLSEGRAPDRFMVGLATLSLLSEAAERRPVLCVVDDAQWLDQASAQALAFAARRLVAESVVMLFAAREPAEQLAGLPHLEIQGVQDDDARQLLASVIPGRLDDRVADQLIAEARGNPLALLELPRGLSPARLAGGFGWPGASSVEGRIEDSFLQQLAQLPQDTRRACWWPRRSRSAIRRSSRARSSASGSSPRSSNRRNRPACSRSMHGCASAIRFCAPRSTAPQPHRIGGRHTGPWPSRPTQPSVRTVAWGPGPRRRPGPTMPSPASSSEPPAAPRRGAASP